MTHQVFFFQATDFVGLGVEALEIMKRNVFLPHHAELTRHHGSSAIHASLMDFL